MQAQGVKLLSRRRFLVDHVPRIEQVSLGEFWRFSFPFDLSEFMSVLARHLTDLRDLRDFDSAVREALDLHPVPKDDLVIFSGGRNVVPLSQLFDHRIVLFGLAKEK